MMEKETVNWKKQFEQEKKRLAEAEAQLQILRKELKATRQALELGMGTSWKGDEKDYRPVRNPFDNLVEHATDVIYLVDEDGYFTLVNSQAVNQFGYRKEDLLGRHFAEFVTPDQRHKVYEFYVRMRDHGLEKSYLEFPVVNAAGEEIWIGQNVTRVKDENGKTYFTAIARDITDKYHKEQKLRSFMTMVTALVTNIRAGMVIEDQDHRIVITNPTFCNLFNLKEKPADLEGSHLPSLFYEYKQVFKTPDAFAAKIRTTLEKKELQAGEEYVLNNGKTVLLSFVPIVSEGEYFGNLWYFEDISTRKDKELQIKRSEEKYRGIIENMEFGIMEVNEHGQIIRAYDRFCKLTGYREVELLGQNAIELLLPPDFKDMMRRNDESRKKGISNVYESEIVTKSGKIINVLIGGAPFYDENGTFIGSIGIHYDITLQKQLQQELEQARQEAENARDAEKEFLANMSHEIRNPINTILGATHLLVDTPLNKEQQELITSLRTSSEILHALVNDILDISKITEGKYELNKKSFNLYDHVHTLAHSFQLPVQSKGLSLLIHLEKDLQVEVNEDKTVLSQILINLFTNALKFTNQGHILFYGSLLADNEDHFIFEFSIKDTGIGISEDRISTIFDRFNQAGKAIQSQYGGTGLGLSICQKLIEMHQGEIKVFSRLNQGSTFTFQMRMDKAVEIPFTEKLSGQAAIEKLRGIRVLIVEDNSMNQQYLTSLFHKLGMLSEVAGDGLKALDLLDRNTFDLILMDIRMPNLDGYETSVRLRALDGNANQHIPIIALTASALMDEKEQALASGMNYHLTKPFLPDQIIDLMIQAVDAHYPGEASLSQIESRKRNQTVTELYDGDWDHYFVMVDVFIRNMPAELQHMSQLLLKQHTESLIHLLHKIKPSFAMIGYPELAKEIEVFELNLEKGTLQQPEQTEFIQQLRERTAAIIKQLTALSVIQP